MANKLKVKGIPVWDGSPLPAEGEPLSYMHFKYYGDAEPSQEDLDALYQLASQAKFQKKYEETMRLKRADRRAQMHEDAGALSHILVGGALGGLSAAVIKKLMNKDKPVEQKDMNKAIAMGATLGGLGGFGIPHLVGMIMGARENKLLQSHVDYIDGNNAWKNYLIPGYAGYRDAIRRKLVKEMTQEK